MKKSLLKLYFQFSSLLLVTETPHHITMHVALWRLNLLVALLC